MACLDLLHDRIVALSGAIVTEWSVVSDAVKEAQENSQRYRYPENHDLHDFCGQLSSLVPGTTATATAAVAVQAAVEGCVIETTAHGDSVAGSHGIAIFAPVRNQVSSDDARDSLTEYAALACNGSPQGAWLDAIELMAMAHADLLLVRGGFGVTIEWETDADVDLWVWEPGGSEDYLDDLHAPWTGQATPNGYFSGDSRSTGETMEYYVANEYAQAGVYDFLVEYFEDGDEADFADVTMRVVWPDAGIDEWAELGTARLDLSNRFGTVYDLGALGSLDELIPFSDWWHPGQLEAAEHGSDLSFRLGASGKHLGVRFLGTPTRRKKGKE
jgi:hypothetical protein